jgi:hypothetical protein
MSVKSDSRSMTLKIFLDAKTFHCLKRSVPPGSNSKLVLNEKTVQLGNIRSSLFGSNVVISCNEVEARNLLLYYRSFAGRDRFNTQGASFCRVIPGLSDTSLSASAARAAKKVKYSRIGNGWLNPALGSE